MNKDLLRVSYDEITDVLYVCLGYPTHTSNTLGSYGVLSRFDSETGKPVGATILDFQGYWCLDNRQPNLTARLSRMLDVPPTYLRRAVQKVLDKNKVE